MIKTEQLTKVFTTEEVETSALSKVDLNVKKGDFVYVIGKTGSDGSFGMR